MNLKDLAAKTAAKKNEAVNLNDCAPIADSWLAAKEAAKVAEATLQMAAEALSAIACPAWIAGNTGKASPASSVLVAGTEGSALVSFAGIYACKGGTEMLPETLVRRKWSLSVDGDAIPAEKADAFVEALLKLAADHGLSDAVGAKVVERYPVADFGIRRFRDLTPEQNAAVEAAGLGTRVSIRVK
jgi:hypothetical protein